MTKELFTELLDDEMAKLRDALGSDAFDSGRFEEAIALFRDMSMADEFEPFLTIPAYRLIV